MTSYIAALHGTDPIGTRHSLYKGGIKIIVEADTHISVIFGKFPHTKEYILDCFNLDDIIPWIDLDLFVLHDANGLPAWVQVDPCSLL
jgi:hypothetical protein